MLKLIVGLGNPTAQYDKTRHNAGFWFLDKLAELRKVVMVQESRFHGETGRLTGSLNEQIHLLKPATFMNRSGVSVGAMVRYYKIEPSEVLVIHDELDIPAGDARLKLGGGHGGHNGIRDIISQLGGRDFYRLRIGIGHPGERSAVIGYVLGAPSPAEKQLMMQSIGRGLTVLPELLDGRLELAMNKLNGANGVKHKKG